MPINVDIVIMIGIESVENFIPIFEIVDTKQRVHVLNNTWPLDL